jgi:hypothetical protein
VSRSDCRRESSQRERESSERARRCQFLRWDADFCQVCGRPHLRCNNTWRIGPFAADCWSVPWKERKILGTLEFPNGKLFALREGDLPNRNHPVPDDWIVKSTSRKQRKAEQPDRLMRKHNINLREFDIAERDWLFKDKSNATKVQSSITPISPSAVTGGAAQEIAGEGEQSGLKDLRTLDHWVCKIETNASRNMPPGGYPLQFEDARPQDFNPTQGDDDETSSTSHIYDYVRSAILDEYGQAAVPRLLKTDKLVNYSGTEPPMEEPKKEKGMMVPRLTPTGDLEAFTPWEDDEVDGDIEGVDVEELHEKLWQYARDGRGNATRVLLEAGADANAVNEYTNTALHFAAMYGWTQVLDVLVEYGGNVDVVNDAQMTPLHYAAYHNHTAAVWCLLRAGANYSKENMFDLTAADMAEAHGDDIILELLIAWHHKDMEEWEMCYGIEFQHSHSPLNYNSRIPHAQPRYCEWNEVDGDYSTHSSDEQRDQELRDQGLIYLSHHKGSLHKMSVNDLCVSTTEHLQSLHKSSRHTKF